MKLFYKIFIVLFLVVVLAANILVTWLDRTPYTQELHYKQTFAGLNRYFEYRDPQIADSLLIGWSERSLIPSREINTIPLAGYGARDPKNAEGIHDSVYVRTIILQNKFDRVALISADLLIIHPEVTKKVYELIKKSNWKSGDIYFGATHTHSSLGSWAPGLVGDLFAGAYDSEMVEFIATQIVNGMLDAERMLSKGSIAFGELDLPDLIRNRLVGEEGMIDPFAKVLYLENEAGRAIDLSFGAHATCLGPEWKEVSGDYPGVFHQILKQDTTLKFASFRAGAVASMTTAAVDTNQWTNADITAKELAEQATLLGLLLPTGEAFLEIESYHLPLYLGPPQLKISSNLVLRPWIFRELVGDYPVEINVARVGKVLMLGLPCDFSGELAVPLYQYARDRGIQLVINSFNGGYIGYVPKDQWYDLNKYETRTMAWYGHDTGAYFTEIIKKLIDKHS